jgi:hypothetical protein
LKDGAGPLRHILLLVRQKINNIKNPRKRGAFRYYPVPACGIIFLRNGMDLCSVSTGGLILVLLPAFKISIKTGINIASVCIETNGAGEGI